MLAFGEALPLLRKHVAYDLALPGLPRGKVLATVLQLLETALIRVGNEAYVCTNRSFGLTILRDRHVDIAGATLRFQFRGKSGKGHTVEINDRRLALIVKRCQEIPGQELFQYRDGEGQRQTIDSADVNDYLRQVTGQDFTSKDFRTWNGTVLTVRALQTCGAGESAAQAKKAVVEAIKSVAARLGNTPAICRKCYVHPSVIEAYLEGSLLEMLQRLGEPDPAGPVQGLSAEEGRVLAFLRQALTLGGTESEIPPPPLEGEATGLATAQGHQIENGPTQTASPLSSAPRASARMMTQFPLTTERMMPKNEFGRLFG
jgi:DNA topoisomerase I